MIMIITSLINHLMSSKILIFSHLYYLSSWSWLFFMTIILKWTELNWDNNDDNGQTHLRLKKLLPVVFIEEAFVFEVLVTCDISGILINHRCFQQKCLYIISDEALTCAGVPSWKCCCLTPSRWTSWSWFGLQIIVMILMTMITMMIIIIVVNWWLRWSTWLCLIWPDTSICYILFLTLGVFVFCHLEWFEGLTWW